MCVQKRPTHVVLFSCIGSAKKRLVRKCAFEITPHWSLRGIKRKGGRERARERDREGGRREGAKQREGGMEIVKLL